MTPFETFLKHNGHILMLYTRTDNIQSALEHLVANSDVVVTVNDLFGIDVRDYWWEYNLLDAKEGVRKEIDDITKTLYNNVIYCQKTKLMKKK